jgi:trigger factor
MIMQAMQVSVEKISNIECRLTVVVPANQFEEAYSRQISELAKKANIKGFRPGKAPIAVIQQRFGGEARSEAMSQVIQKALFAALAEKKLSPVSMPKIEPKMTGFDQPIEFVASFEVLPEIENVNFNMANIEKLDVEVSAEDVDRVIEQLGKQYTKWQVVTRKAKNKDRLVIDYRMLSEGVEPEGNKVENVPLELGSKTMLPGFEEGLIGTQAGDEKTLSLHFPADFPVAEKAGKPVEFVIQVKQVYEAEAPEITEEFVKRLGVASGSIDELKQQIRQSLEQERDRLVKEKLKEQVFGQLIEQNPLEVPSSLVAREAKSIHDEVYPSDQHHDHHQHSDDEMTTFNNIAKKRVALGLLIAEYAKKAGVKADNARVEKRIQEIASVYEHPQEVIAWLSSKERRAGIEAQVVEDQVMDKLMEGIPATSKKISYAELKGIRI